MMDELVQKTLHIENEVKWLTLWTAQFEIFLNENLLIGNKIS